MVLVKSTLINKSIVHATCKHTHTTHAYRTQFIMLRACKKNLKKKCSMLHLQTYPPHSNEWRVGRYRAHFQPLNNMDANHVHRYVEYAMWTNSNPHENPAGHHRHGIGLLKWSNVNFMLKNIFHIFLFLFSLSQRRKCNKPTKQPRWQSFILKMLTIRQFGILVLFFFLFLFWKKTHVPTCA